MASLPSAIGRPSGTYARVVISPPPLRLPPPDLLATGAVVRPLAHNAVNQATGGIWRVSTPGQPDRVLKIAVPARRGPAAAWGTSDEPGHWNYWRRELLAYRSGLAACAYPGILVPATPEMRELDDGSVAIWLEAVDGPAGGGWTLDQFETFATLLGAGQARWLNRALPYPWLSRSWLRQYRDGRRPETDVAWDHPDVAAAWPVPLRAGLARLARESEALLRVVESGPRTLAHLDVWPANLIWSGRGPVLLDWSFVGDGAVGEDIGNLIIDSVADGHIHIGGLPELIDAVTSGYRAGLAGAVADVDVMRGIRASAAAKYAWFGPRVASRVARAEGVGSSFYDTGGSVGDKLARWRPMLELLVDWSTGILDG
jgi:hypothetical protein